MKWTNQGEQHLILEGVSENLIACFLRERAHGVPQSVHLGIKLFPAFKAQGKEPRSTIQVESREDAMLKADDRFGHGTYNVFDVRAVQSVQIVTNGGSTFSAIRNGKGFTVRVFMKSPCNLSRWADQEEWQKGPLPAA